MLAPTTIFDRICRGDHWSPATLNSQIYILNVGIGLPDGPFRASIARPYIYMPIVLCIFLPFLPILMAEGMVVKEKEREKPVPWELTDPKPPVIRSGHMENRVQHGK